MVICVGGVFLTTDSDEDVVMELKGPLAELMCKINPSLYRKFIATNSKGQAILYVKIHKALYGLMRSALLFYRRMVKELESYGFELNPYDPCVANIDINGDQMTICWHVDDLLCTHKSNFELTKLALYLKERFGGISVTRGDVFTYLGIDFDHSTKGEVAVSMIPYLNDLLREFPEQLGTPQATPAADHLFEVREEEDAQLLPEEQAVAFHHTTAQLLFLSSRARRDI